MNLAATVTESKASAYAKYVNPQWVRLLDVLGLNVDYVRCEGSELWTADGSRILDFNSGYCVHNVGHNHPQVVAALKHELDRRGPAMMQGHVPDLAGELAERLCTRAGGLATKAFFANSGSEGVEAVIKFSRARTGRPGILYCSGAFHGLTCGALSLMDNAFWTNGFGPLLSETKAIPFGDADALARELATRRYAAFVVEPIQAEAGVLVPFPEYLQAAQALCRQFGTLFVVDEVQTGLHRTGPFLASHHFGVEPDMVVLAKALSGGLVPVGAVLMSDAIYDSVYTSFKRAIVHTSTYGENGLAMRAGLATLDVLEGEKLGERAERVGEHLRRELARRLSRFSMIEDVRGMGLLSAIAFHRPREIRLRFLFDAFTSIHPAMFGQVLVMRLFGDHRIFSQVCGNNFMVLKLSPSLNVPDSAVDTLVEAVESVVELMHRSTRFWSEALRMARRVMHVI
jgi:ornithine--oxo-acid transaminase